MSFRRSPAGWDNEKKVAILYENMHSVNPDHYYTDVIARPMITIPIMNMAMSLPNDPSSLAGSTSSK